jgi:D-tyrosyl-tRNA(Tyr) deacylase
MRAVIQRVSEAHVTTNGSLIAKINRGLLVLVAIDPADTQDDVDRLAGKIVRLRIFPDVQGVMNLSVQDIHGEILVVSQFTLLASTKKGNRPSYSRAAPPELAKHIYDTFVTTLTTHLGKPVQTGIFGADMKVHLINDGPVTIIIDTKLRE